MKGEIEEKGLDGKDREREGYRQPIEKRTEQQDKARLQTKEINVHSTGWGIKTAASDWRFQRKGETERRWMYKWKTWTPRLVNPSRVEKSEKDSSCLANASQVTSFLFEAKGMETSHLLTRAKP